MKRLFLLKIMCLYAFFAFTQSTDIPINEDTGLITWQEVVNQDGSPQVLYKRAIEWINSYFPNPHNVTKIRDEVNGRIIINHSIKTNNIINGEEIASNTIVNYVLRIEFKENRYRYTFTEFTMRASSKFPLEKWLDTTHQSYQAVWADYLVQVEQNIQYTIESMKEGMKEKIVKEDIW